MEILLLFWNSIWTLKYVYRIRTIIDIITELLDVTCAPVTKTEMMNRAIIMDRGLIVRSLPLSKSHTWVEPILYIYSPCRGNDFSPTIRNWLINTIDLSKLSALPVQGATALFSRPLPWLRTNLILTPFKNWHPRFRMRVAVRTFLKAESTVVFNR